MELQPGDMRATGTPAGVGHRRTPPIFMKPGDVLEIEISGIGILRNPVIDESTLVITSEALYGRPGTIHRVRCDM